MSNDCNLSISQFWQIPNNCYEIRLCKFICKLITKCPQDSLYVCHLCSKQYRNLFAHFTCSCAITFNIRNEWWEYITNTFRIELSVELCAVTEEDLFLILLCRRTDTELDTKEFQSLCIKNFKLIQDSAALYHRFMQYQSIVTLIHPEHIILICVPADLVHTYYINT